MPFLFSALAIRAVGRTAGVVVREVRDQFADGQIMAGTKQPDYGPVIDICTAASLRELTTPALLAVLTPVIVGFGIGWQALGGFLAAVILTGQLMANYLSNSGGAWDNAKKYIEDGHHGGKGSEPHKAAVIGDTVGDPFKDTAGPALNPLIKVMNLVSLLMLPAIINLETDDNAARFVIAGIAGARADRGDHLLVAQDRGDRRGVDTGGTGAEARSNRRLMRSPAGGLASILALGPDFLKPEWWFDKAGSAALAIVTAIIFAESGLLFGFFLPGDSLLFFTGFLTSSAAMEEAPFSEFAEHIPALPIVLVCLAVAAIVGDQVGYLFGRRVGPSLFNRPNSRLFKAENVTKAHVFFEKHGPKSIVLARFVPIVRTFTPIVAGIAEMRYRTFVTYNVIGGLLVGGRHHHPRPLPRRDRVLPREHRVRHRRHRVDLAAPDRHRVLSPPPRRHAAVAPADGFSCSDPVRSGRSASGERRTALEGAHPVGDDGGDLGVLALEVVAAVEPVVGHRAGDRRRPLLQLVGRAERISCPVHEQPRHRDVGQVLDAQALRPARRVQRIGDRHHAEQALRRRHTVGSGGDHRADPPAHRAPADDDVAATADRRQLVADRGHQHLRLVRGPPPRLAVREVGTYRRPARQRRDGGVDATSVG